MVVTPRSSSTTVSDSLWLLVCSTSTDGRQDLGQHGLSSTWGASQLTFSVLWSQTNSSAGTPQMHSEFLLAVALLILFYPLGSSASWFLPNFKTLNTFQDTSLMPSLHKFFATLQYHVVLQSFPPLNTIQFFVNSWHFCLCICLLPVFPSLSLCSPQTLLYSWIYAYFLSVFSIVWKSVHYKVRSQLLFEMNWKKYISPSDPKHHLQSQNRMMNYFVYGEGTIHCIMEKEMAIHSNIVAWRIPWTEEPCGLQFMGSQRVGHS